MTDGWPARFTEVLAVYMYDTTFVYQDYCHGSAISIVIIMLLFMVIAAFFLVWLSCSSLKPNAGIVLHVPALPQAPSFLEAADP